MNTSKKGARESRDMSKFNPADYSFVEGAATKENGEIGPVILSGENVRKWLAPMVYHMIVGPTDEEIKALQGALAAFIIKLFYGADPAMKNYDIALKFIQLVREQAAKVETGEVSKKEAIDFAHDNRKPGKEVLIKMKVSAEEQAILERIRAEKAAQEKAAQQPAAKTAKKAGK